MNTATLVEILLVALTLGGLVVTCLVDPAGLVDAKYGKDGQ